MPSNGSVSLVFEYWILRIRNGAQECIFSGVHCFGHTAAAACSPHAVCDHTQVHTRQLVEQLAYGCLGRARSRPEEVFG